MSANHPEGTFIHDPQATYDFCQSPSHLQQHGSFSFDFPRQSRLRPLFQWSKQYRNSDILSTPLEAYSNTSTYIPWDQKTDKRIFWRGSPTGDSYRKGKHTDDLGGWRMSHRPRLALMAQETEGMRKVWVQRGKVWKLEEWNRRELNEEYLDIGLTGHPHQVCPHYLRSHLYPLTPRSRPKKDDSDAQCNKEDGTCDEMESEIKWANRVTPAQAAKSKCMSSISSLSLTLPNPTLATVLREGLTSRCLRCRWQRMVIPFSQIVNVGECSSQIDNPTRMEFCTSTLFFLFQR